ncbi:MAG: hypothetical protein ACC652_02540, partial [Acidimicrobiales bacterium]
MHSLVASRRSGALLFVAVALVLAGCTGNDGDSNKSTSSTQADAGDGAPLQSGDDQAIAVERLGFDTAVYEIPTPADSAEDEPAFPDAVSMIDAGVEAGVWT